MRQYYSVRNGRNPGAIRIDLPLLKRLFKSLHDELDEQGYFQEAFGYDCVDSGFCPGTLGRDLDAALLLRLRKANLTPIRTRLQFYDEADLFDIIELLFDHCSKPTQSSYHQFNNCGLHATAFSSEPGRALFRERVNQIIAQYNDGFELSADGEVLVLPDSGLSGLFEAAIPTDQPRNVEERIEAAKRKYRRFRATLDERRDAVRDLADVLEFIPPELKKALDTKDEADLFNVVNNFGIRHHNIDQKTDYDPAIFFSWLFYHYLAALHAGLRLIERSKKAAKP